MINEDNYKTVQEIKKREEEIRNLDRQIDGISYSIMFEINLVEHLFEI